MNPIDREALIKHSWDILMAILFQPQTHLAMALYLLVGCLVLAVGLAKAHGLTNAGSSSPILGLLCGVFCVFAMVEIAALLQIYVLKNIDNHDLRIPALVGGLVVAFLLMIVPFTRMWFRSGYGGTVAAWILALLLSALAVFGMKQVYDPKPEKPEDALHDYHSFGSKVKEGLDKEIKERTEAPVPEP